MRCKQSDIFAKFMYLRHRVILSHFGEMYSRTHTHTLARTHFICVTSVFSIKHIETTIRTRGYAKRGAEKNTHHREKIFDVKPTNKKNLFRCREREREKSSYHVLSDWCYTMGLSCAHCHSYFVDWLTFYAIPKLCLCVYEPVWSFSCSFAFFGC